MRSAAHGGRYTVTHNIHACATRRVTETYFQVQSNIIQWRPRATMLEKLSVVRPRSTHSSPFTLKKESRINGGRERDRNVPMWTLSCNCATQSTSIDFPCFAKSKNSHSKCVRRQSMLSPMFGVELFNFRCCPWSSSADETLARRSFCVRYPLRVAAPVQLATSIRDRWKFIN